MSSIEAIVYGIIQGLSEFLPVSSSGHLALLPYMMRIKDPGVVFDLIMHLGTAFAVVTYFRKEIYGYAKTFTPDLLNLKQGTPAQWFTRNFIAATCVSVVLIVTLIPVSKWARDPNIIVFNLVVFGAILWISDEMNRRKTQLLDSPMETQMQWKMAALLGAAQALAIFPGVSRSGITLSVALILGMRRKEAGAFSFLMSLPIIIAGILKEVPDLMNAENERLVPLLWGITTSFIVGWLTIHFFMKLIGTIRLGYFAVYRWALAILMLVMLS